MSVLGHATVCDQRPSIPPLLSALRHTSDVAEWANLNTYGTSFLEVSNSEDPTRVFPKYINAWWKYETTELAQKAHEGEKSSDIFEDHYKEVRIFFSLLNQIHVLVPLFCRDSRTP